MNQFAYPWAFVLLLLPFAVRFALPAVKGLHGDALKIPFLKDLEKYPLNPAAYGRWEAPPTRNIFPNSSGCS